MAARLPAALRAKANEKKARGARASEYMLTLKQMGDEPMFSPLVEITDDQYSSALRWYNAVCSREDAREYAEKYLRQTGRTEDAKRLKRVPDAWFPLHIGWIGRMATRGVKLKQRSLDAFETRLQEAFTKIPDDEKPAAVRNVVSIQDRVAEKASELMYELEKMVDDHGYQPSFSVYDWLTKKQVSAALVPHMIRHFKPIAEEALELISPNCDPQLKEGYRNYSRAHSKTMASYYQKLMADFDRYLGNAKKQRAPRKKKAVTPDKKLKNFKYQKESKELRLVSINPEKMFEADELWTLNTKYKVLTVIRRAEGQSLDVSGSSFKNYDEDKSKSYRLGRKVEATIEDVTKAGKRALGKVVEKLKETSLQSRSNENTILLKVI